MRLNNFTLAVLATSVAAVPHRRNVHQHPVRRDVDVVTTSVFEIQKTVLYVDQNGNPVATSLQPVDAAPTDPAVGAADNGRPWGQPPPAYGSGDYAPQPVPTPSSQDSNSETPSTPPLQTTQAPPPSSNSSPDTSSAPPAQSAPSEGGDVEDVSGYSIAYTPYNGDNSCKTKDEVDTDIDNLKDDNYRMVRIYGTDCEQVPNIMSAAKRNNMKVFLGIYNVHNVAAEAQLLIDGAKHDWGRVDTVSVGNEVLNRHEGTVSDVVNGINTARSLLRAAGYSNPVTTVEVYGTIMMEENRDLCNAVDYIAANCHPFFNSAKTAEEAGSYVREQAEKLSEWCTDRKDVVITETGWPSDGQTNGKAVPGRINQQTALKSLRQAYVDNPNGLILFSAYNDAWKLDNAGTHGAEKFWGIYGNAPSAR